ncbi:hypothetical protein [Pseudomonas alabamensis]|uniref:hypothetical protein n=1 Tax=Pseudomonas alabamensis TaxID=3064349 RepID=UPI0012D9CE58
MKWYNAPKMSQRHDSTKYVLPNSSFSLTRRLPTVVAIAMLVTYSADSLPDVTLGDKVLKLEEHAGQCILKDGFQEFPLAMPAPCRFSQDRAGKARIEYFNGIPIVLVTHVESDPSSRGDCVKISRALRWTAAGLSLSDYAKSSSCSIEMEDTKNFTGLFEW